MPKPTGYYHYGEGSIIHSDTGVCPEGLGISHPEIHRTHWSSRWAYYRHLARRWYFHREMRRLIRPKPGDQTLRIRFSIFDRPAKWLLGPTNHDKPAVHIPMRGEDSIYGAESAQRDREHWEAFWTNRTKV